MPARVSGKLKAWIYAFAGIGGIVVFSARTSSAGFLEPMAGIQAVVLRAFRPGRGGGALVSGRLCGCFF